ncbi:toxin Doc [Streptomyces sp. NBC_01465]|uniref:toxin Doc n=1 Tax=Streptomyces sp. NBC_01465 TaxID=2903878 RepID=UPI002E356AF1|nr:toxin Doc [Streptomyces sp. NBC_01465]
MELLIDHRWLLAQQEVLLGKDLTVHDYSIFVGMGARHRVNTPRLGEEPDASWRAAVLVEELVLLRPLPARNEYFAYGVATAYLEASAQPIEAAYELWRDLITDIRALRLDVYDIADRLRSWSI